MSSVKSPDDGPALSQRYINREASWLEFNRRVLAEAGNPDNPLLERLKFLAIFESNLDEFYMVRVSGLIEQYEGGVVELTPDGLNPEEQLAMIAELARPMRREASDLFTRDLVPNLATAGIHVRTYDELTARQKQTLEEVFRRDIFPVCTPLLLHPTPSAPFISNRSLNLAVELEDAETGTKLARVKVPSVLPRLIRLHKRRHEYVFLEEVIQHNLANLFPGVEVKGAYTFRVLRDADIEIRELEAADLLNAIEQSIRLRRFGAPVLLECADAMPEAVRHRLMTLLELEETDVFGIDGILGLEALWEIARIERPQHRYPTHHPHTAKDVGRASLLFDAISRRDILVHHPFDSFDSVEKFVDTAATDPAVIGIKQTLYRVGSESPIVESLLAAAESGKQVAAMVELKARFDESNNLVWARALEQAGAHVTYGFAELKTHGKLCLVVRREGGRLKSYAHIGTGNYNPITARIYTDIGLFTADPEIVQDVAELFNVLTGFGRQTKFRRLLVAPYNLREGIIERIDREIERHQAHGDGQIIFKLNSLVDPEVIDALYVANTAGVSVELIVRGICCLRPGVPGLSENIRVRSIVGRFLEHSRIYAFRNGGDLEALIGSADLMRRNLDRRIEVLVPVVRPELVKLLWDIVLKSGLQDNQKSWSMDANGQYQRIQSEPGEAVHDSHRWLMDYPLTRIQLD